jgi:hypothetical protein
MRTLIINENIICNIDALNFASYLNVDEWILRLSFCSDTVDIPYDSEEDAKKAFEHVRSFLHSIKDA